MTWALLIVAAVAAWWLWRDRRVRAALSSSRWRPVAGVVVLAALVAAVAATLRGAWPVGLGAAAVALWAALFVRKDPGRAAEPEQAREPLSVTDARSLLGLAEGADEAAIEEAYRRLMRRAHPDLGGSTGLAAQLNAARAVLLEQARR